MDKGRAPFRVYAAMFLLAFSALQLQVALTRILSVMLWNHFTFMVISIALCGFGAAGSWQSMRPKRPEPADLSRAGFIYAFCLLGSFFLITRFWFEPLRVLQEPVDLLSLVFVYVLIGIPFLFVGICTIGVLTVHSNDVHRIYLADLVGAGVGSLASVGFIGWIGAPNTIFLSAFLGGVSGLLLQLHQGGGRQKRALIGVAALAGVLALGIVWDPYLVRTAPLKELSFFVRPGNGYSNLESRGWHVLGRIDVTKPMVVPEWQVGGSHREDRLRVRNRIRYIFQDGGAGTRMLLFDGDLSKLESMHDFFPAAAYQVSSKPRALVIGAGGGTDLLVALVNGATHVVGVDINPLTVQALRTHADDSAGRILERPDVEVHAAEGRHFVSRSTEVYDVIQVTGVDSYTAAASGARSLNEGLLYTVEATEAFWNHLTPGGTLSFVRWLFDPPRETLRLVATVVEALERLGVKDPAKHLFILRTHEFSNMLLKRDGFTVEEVERLKAWGAKNKFPVVYDPFTDRKTPFDLVLRGKPADRLAFYDLYDYDVTPATDDRPFFFDYYKWRNLFSSGVSDGGYLTTSMPVGLMTLAFGGLQVLVLAILGIWIPARRLSTGPQSSRRAVMLYFGGIGLGFSLIEVGLMQRLEVFVGGPTYSLAVTLFAMLTIAGLGSGLARSRHVTKLVSSDRFGALGLAIALVTICLAFGLDAATSHLLHLGWTARFLVTTLLVAPLALLLGMAFPLGLHVLNVRSKGTIPWAWAINSFATVFGPVLAVAIAMAAGFRVVFAIAAVGYLLAFWGFRGMLAEK